MRGLYETGGVKELPIWYNVYKKYPPNPEPNRDRPPAPQDPIPEIVYKRDFERAKKAKSKQPDVLNYLWDEKQDEKSHSEKKGL